jgi:hypothetical protein
VSRIYSDIIQAYFGKSLAREKPGVFFEDLSSRNTPESQDYNGYSPKNGD